jgi:two-component system chemotaxis sensor kinase CheA
VTALSERDLLRLILMPGFSTATRVTEVSGRGIGLDIVDKNISAVGGSISIESELGRGTKFTIRLPLTVAVLHGLSARVGAELYIVPLPAVAECLDLPTDVQAANGYSGVFSLRGEAVPFLRLAHHFQSSGQAAASEKLVVVEYDRRRAALVVDELIGETRAVVKPMSRLFRRSTWISGSALLANGEIGLVLEVASILDDVAHDHAGQSAGKDMR